MPTPREQKIINKLNVMTIDEARLAIASAQFGHNGSQDHTFASGWLDVKEASLRDKRETESLSISRKALAISEDANSIAIDANRIADRALSNSKTANIWAAIATLIAAIAMYIAYVEYIKNP